LAAAEDVGTVARGQSDWAGGYFCSFQTRSNVAQRGPTILTVFRAHSAVPGRVGTAPADDDIQTSGKSESVS
jgi:hypothetical protein